MGKRKKSTRKPATPRTRVPLDTTFTCLFCHHEKSVNVKIDRKEGVANLLCRVCSQRFQTKVNHLLEPIDIYAEWMDAADKAQEGEGDDVHGAGPSRPRSQPGEASDED